MIWVFDQIGATEQVLRAVYVLSWRVVDRLQQEKIRYRAISHFLVFTGNLFGRITRFASARNLEENIASGCFSVVFLGRRSPNEQNDDLVERPMEPSVVACLPAWTSSTRASPGQISRQKTPSVTVFGDSFSGESDSEWL